jgi:hypothetical protein
LDVAAGQETALLVRAQVSDEADQFIALDPAIIEQRVALGSRAIAGNALPGVALVEQEAKEFRADAVDPRLEIFVHLTAAQTGALLLGKDKID